MENATKRIVIQVVGTRRNTTLKVEHDERIRGIYAGFSVSKDHFDHQVSTLGVRHKSAKALSDLLKVVDVFEEIQAEKEWVHLHVRGKGTNSRSIVFRVSRV